MRKAQVDAAHDVQARDLILAEDNVERAKIVLQLRKRARAEDRGASPPG